jgi:hypothetical protein
LIHKLKVERAFRQYIGAVFEYLSSSETCLVRGWPDKRLVIREAFRIQELANRRTELRFEYLLKEHGAEDAIWSSFEKISRIWDRIHDGWQSIEEVALKKGSPAYDRLTAEIDKLQSALDPRALEGPFQDAQRDREYLDARGRMQDRIRELESELVTSSAR